MSNCTPSVSVIVLTWNNKADTLECLESLYQLDYANYCLVVVDNGSIDGTVEAVLNRFPDVQVIENGQNLGYAEGNNVGIRYALNQEADYILILNNDTVVDPTILQELVSVAQMHPQSAVFCPKIYCYSPPTTMMFAGAKWDSEKALFRYKGLGEPDNGEANTLSETDVGSGCALFFRSEIIPDIGLFDPRFFLLWEETDWCCRVKNRGFSLLFVPSARVWHKISRSFEGQEQGAQYQYYFMRNRLLWIEKNLTGKEKASALIRCLRETYWQILLAKRKSWLFLKDERLRATLKGWLHYISRQFGQQKM